jgi:hypothetical protein
MVPQGGINVVVIKRRLLVPRCGKCGGYKMYVYILKSLIKDRFYIGCTANLGNRLKEHNLGKTRSTKTYKPWKIVYFI